MDHWHIVKGMLQKEWQTERRAGNLIVPTLFLALVIVFVFSFSFSPGALPPNVAGIGAFWIAMVVSIVLGIGKSYSGEREMGAWQGVVRCVTDPRGILTSKIIWFFAMSMIVALVLMPILDLIYHASFLAQFLLFLPGLILCVLGLTVLGAVFGIMLAQNKAREMLFSIIVFPLFTPLLILAAKVGTMALAGSPLAEQLFYFKLIGATDLVFLFMGYWSVEQLLDL